MIEYVSHSYWKSGMLNYSQSFVRANNEVLTASDSSIGNSGGTTDVRIRVQFRNNLYLLRFSFLVPTNFKEIFELINNQIVWIKVT